jgi:hypothetical protein
MAYNYISAMNPVTASAQLSNLGLVAVPILSAFAGLRELIYVETTYVRPTNFLRCSKLDHPSSTSMFCVPNRQ